MGFPISPHQFSVLGSSNIKAQIAQPIAFSCWYASLSPSTCRPDAAPETDRGLGGKKPAHTCNLLDPLKKLATKDWAEAQ